nr:hypothetical protein HmN_000336100 [Hymenolepis microstoma]
MKSQLTRFPLTENDEGDEEVEDGKEGAENEKNEEDEGDHDGGDDDDNDTGDAICCRIFIAILLLTNAIDQTGAGWVVYQPDPNGGSPRSVPVYRKDDGDGENGWQNSDDIYDNPQPNPEW